MGVRILTNEKEPGATIAHHKNIGLALRHPDRFHGDIEKFADRLVKIL